MGSSPELRGASIQLSEPLRHDGDCSPLVSGLLLRATCTAATSRVTTLRTKWGRMSARVNRVESEMIRTEVHQGFVKVIHRTKSHTTNWFIAEFRDSRAGRKRALITDHPDHSNTAELLLGASRQAS